MLKALSETVELSFWEKPDDSHTVMRIATSWSTTDEDVNMLVEQLRKISGSFML